VNADPGPLLYSFFEDHLKCQKGLRPSSLKSYRDSLRLFLLFVAEKTGHKVSRLTLAELTCAQVLAFLQSVETDRHNHVRTRNQRLAATRGSCSSPMSPVGGSHRTYFVTRPPSTFWRPGWRRT
jgi:hypothetical protein